MGKNPAFGSAALRRNWANFAKGYNSVRQPQDMTPDELSDVMNFRYVLTPSGVGLTNRPGMVKVTTTAITTAAVKDLHKYVDTAGNVRYLAVADSKLWVSTLGTSWTSAGTLGSTRGRMVNFAGKAVIADGAALKYYTTATFGTTTGPSASFVAVHGDRLLANSVTVKNALYYCNVRDPLDWSTAGATGTIYISESNELTGFSKFYDKVLIHGIAPKNIMGLTGTTPQDMQIGRVIPGAAAVGPDQTVVLSNDVLFMDSPGLVSFRAWQNYGDIEQSLVSDPVSNIILPMVGTGVIAGRSPIDQQAWFYDGSSNPATIYVYDAQYRIWTKYSLELGAGVTPTCIADLDGVLYVGTSDSHIWRMDTTNLIFQDNAVNYSLYWKGNAENFGTIRKKLIRRYLPGATLPAGATSNASLYKDLAASPSLQVPLTGAPSRILSTMTGTADTVTLATYYVDESGGVVKNQLLNMEAVYLQVGMSNILANNGRVTINPHVVEAAVLSRY